jgi:hypothetical protein
MRVAVLLVALATLALAWVGGGSAAKPSEFALPSATAVVASPGTAGLVVEWSQVPGARSYRVFRSTRIPAPSLVAIVPGDEHRFEDRTLTPGVTYAYRIVAYADPEHPSGPIGAFTGQGTAGSTRPAGHTGSNERAPARSPSLSPALLTPLP